MRVTIVSTLVLVVLAVLILITGCKPQPKPAAPAAPHAEILFDEMVIRASPPRHKRPSPQKRSAGRKNGSAAAKSPKVTVEAHMIGAAPDPRRATSLMHRVATAPRPW
jgi:hypothetical protein